MMLPRPSVHIRRRWKAALYGVLMASWLTGSAWWSFERWVRVAGEFGDEHHPAQAWFLKIHGGAAMLQLLLFGYLWGMHVTAGWRSRRNRLLGGLLVGNFLTLIVTSYGLYYLNEEQGRDWAHNIHVCAGVALPFIIAAHVFAGHRSGKQRATREIPVEP